MRPFRRPRVATRVVVAGPVAVLVAAVLAACAPPGGAPTSPDTQPSTPVTATSPTVVPTATALTEIPPAAFLQPEDLGPGDAITDGMVLEAWLNICGETRLGSDGMLATQSYIGFRYYYSGNRDASDGYGYEVMSSYRPGGAEAYLAEVRERVAGPCSRFEDDEYVIEHAVVAEAFGGDDAIRILRRTTFTANGRSNTSYGVVVRFGDVVAFICVITPWDGSDHAGYVDRIVAAALSRATALP